MTYDKYVDNFLSWFVSIIYFVLMVGTYLLIHWSQTQDKALL